MKIIFYALLFTVVMALPAYAQLPTKSFAVTSACPGNAGNPSVLGEIQTDGSFKPIEPTATVREDGTPIRVNGLGYDQDDQTVLYAMQVVQPTFNFTTLTLNNPAPILYRINLTTAAATNVGTVTPPPTPTSGLTAPNAGETATDLRETLNFVADSDPDATYYTGGLTLRVIYQTIFGIPIPATARVTDVRLYVGTVNLKAIAAPVWQELTTDLTTAAILETERVQVENYIRKNFSGPFPEGGIQDWVYDRATNNLVSYVGQSGQYLTITNPGSTTPVGVTSTPTVPLPLPTTTDDLNIGSMFSDKFYNVYVVRAGSGEIFRVDHSTGDYSGQSYGSALGCNRGDAVSFPDALPLPVELTSFTARAAPQGVAVAWATASEKDAATFQLERSSDGQQWQTWRSVPATNRAAGARYAALDTAPLPGTSYYRLRMVDQDGTTAYSTVQSVTVAAPAATLQAFPNPAGQFLIVRPAAPGDQLQVLNSTGQVVWHQTDGSSGARISVAAWPAGLYYVRSQGQGHALLSQKVVVVH